MIKQVDKAESYGTDILDELYRVILDRKEKLPAGSYTAGLFAGGRDRILKKIGEEATEVVIAGKNENKKEIVLEASDLMYHLLVLLADADIDISSVYGELAGRRIYSYKK